MILRGMSCDEDFGRGIKASEAFMMGKMMINLDSSGYLMRFGMAWISGSTISTHLLL